MILKHFKTIRNNKNNQNKCIDATKPYNCVQKLILVTALVIKGGSMMIL